MRSHRPPADDLTDHLYLCEGFRCPLEGWRIEMQELPHALSGEQARYKAKMAKSFFISPRQKRFYVLLNFFSVFVKHVKAVGILLFMVDETLIYTRQLAYTRPDGNY